MITFCATPTLNPLDLPTAHSRGWFVRFRDGVWMWVCVGVCVVMVVMAYSVVSSKI